MTIDFGFVRLTINNKDLRYLYNRQFTDSINDYMFEQRVIKINI